MAAVAKKATCPNCKKQVRVLASGNLAAHNITTKPIKTCPGSYRKAGG